MEVEAKMAVVRAVNPDGTGIVSDANPAYITAILIGEVD